MNDVAFFLPLGLVITGGMGKRGSSGRRKAMCIESIEIDLLTVTFVTMIWSVLVFSVGWAISSYVK